jgi:hypothetical protein
VELKGRRREKKHGKGLYDTLSSIDAFTFPERNVSCLVSEGIKHPLTVRPAMIFVFYENDLPFLLAGLQ